MNKKISELTSGGVLDGTEYIPVVQGGATVKVFVHDIIDFINKGTATLSGGSVTVTNSKVRTTSVFSLTVHVTSGVRGHLRIENIVNNTSFDIVSGSDSDNSQVDWIFYN